MRRYETFVIINPDISQEQIAPVRDRVKELITQLDGYLVFEDVWGERKLAYEIKKKERGYYVRFDYCGLPTLVNEIERFFRIDDRALKYMTVVLDKEVDLEKVKEEQAAAESKRQAEAASQESPPETEAAPQEKPPETEAAPQETPPETEAADRPQEEAREKETAAEETPPQPEPPVEKEAQASEPMESAEHITPAEKKEEA